MIMYTRSTTCVSLLTFTPSMLLALLLLETLCINTQSFSPSKAHMTPLHYHLSFMHMTSKSSKSNNEKKFTYDDDEDDEEEEDNNKKMMMVTIAYQNLMNDMSNMKTTRTSKFELAVPLSSHSSSVLSIQKRSSVQKKNIFMKLFSENVNLCKLYYDQQDDHILQQKTEEVHEKEDVLRVEENRMYDYHYFTNMTNIVGPMYRRQIELMLQRHPQLVTDLLTNMKNDNIIKMKLNDDFFDNRTTMQKSEYKKVRRTSLRSVQDQILMDLNLPLKDQKRLLSTFKSKATSFTKLNRKNLRKIFQLLHNIGMNDESICKMLIKAPQLFSYTTINIQNSITYLKEMKLTNEDICKMIVIRPMVLAHCNKKGEKMDLIVHFFENELGLDSRSILIKYPQVFELKPDVLVEKKEFLCNAFKLHRWIDLSSMISTFPPLLWLSHSTILEKVNFLSTEFQLDDTELRDVLVTYPQVLGLSVEKNLQFKLDYFTGEDVALSRQRLKELVLYQPALLAYSLEKRIKPRILCLKENYISFSYAPPYLMSLSDCKFEQWVEMQKSTWTIN